MGENMSLESTLAVRANKKIYRDGDKLVKLFDESYSKSSILNEAINQARVEETGLNIPKITEVKVIDGKWAIVMDYIEGKTLEQLMQEHPEKTDEYLDLFIKIQAEIHEKRSPLLTKFQDKLTTKILKSELDASTRYDYCNQVANMPRHAHVCHGDFNPSNVVITKNGKHYVLDWSHASQGNATADAVKTYLIFYMNGEKELAEKYIRKYAEFSETEWSYIKKWIPLVASAQLIKVNETQKRILMQFIDGEDENE